MLDTTITLVGNLVDDPAHRTTANGASVCTFRLASTPRRFDRSESRWVDGDTLFLRVTCWRQLADNVAASLARGDRALVCGRLRQRSFETSEGERRVAYEIDADAVGAELTWHAARSQRFARRSAATETPPPDEVDLPDGGPLADPQDEPGEESVESGEEVIREPEPALSQAADIGPLSRVLAGEAPIGVASLHRPQDRRFQDTAPLPAAPAGGAAPFGPPATAPYGPAAAAGLTGAEVGAPAWRSVTTVTGQF